MALYHKGLGDCLKKKGHNVVYAITDNMPIESSGVSFKNENYYIFSNFFKINEFNSVVSEKYCSLNLWKTYFSDYDRYISHYNLKTYDKVYYSNLISNLVCFFDSIITKNNIDYILYENLSNSFAYIAYEIGKANGVKYRGYVGSRLANRFELHTEEYGIKDEFKVIFEQFNIGDLTEEDSANLDNYLSKYNGKEIPSYHSKTTKLSADYSVVKRYFNKEKYKQTLAALRESFKKRNEFKYNYQIFNPISTLFLLFRRQMLKKYRTFNGKKYFEDIDINERYFLFPLHMKPESSTSVLARHYCDDIAVIKNIAFNLPFGTMLYVKEHFVNFGNLPISFYQELKKIPNVKLIDCNANTMELVRNCEALITLTSTMGLEALLMNKKVILFGNVFYECHPNCIKMSNFDTLFEVLRDLEKPTQDLTLSKRFIGAYHKITFLGNVGYPIYETEDIEKFSNYFISALSSYDEIK